MEGIRFCPLVENSGSGIVPYGSYCEVSSFIYSWIYIKRNSVHSNSPVSNINVEMLQRKWNRHVCLHVQVLSIPLILHLHVYKNAVMRTTSSNLAQRWLITKWCAMINHKISDSFESCIHCTINGHQNS